MFRFFVFFSDDICVGSFTKYISSIFIIIQFHCVMLSSFLFFFLIERIVRIELEYNVDWSRNLFKKCRLLLYF